MKKLISALEKHPNHTIDCVETPYKLHYAKLCCRDCGNHRGSKFLMWVGPHEMKAMGYWTEQQATEQIKLKRKLKNKQIKKPTKWAQATPKERNFYKNYQPSTESYNATQLVGDRLALRGRSQYNGNPLGSIPITYLKSILATKINNKSDKQYIEKHIELRSGPYPGSSDTITA